MSSSNNYKYYVQDLGRLIKENALRAREEFSESIGDENNFDKGVVFAYYKIISLMQQQAKAFDIELIDINLDDIDPDKQLT